HCHQRRGALQTAQSPAEAADISTREPLGRVMAVDGTQATIRLNIANRSRTAEDGRATVGKFMAIYTGESMLVGIVTKISTPALRPGEGPDYAIGQLDLLGEIKQDGTRRFFQRGITDYPLIGDSVDLLRRDELRLIYDIAGPNTINIGA